MLKVAQRKQRKHIQLLHTIQFLQIMEGMNKFDLEKINGHFSDLCVSACKWY